MAADTLPDDLGELPHCVPSPAVLGYLELVLEGVFGSQRSMSVDVPAEIADAAERAGSLIITDDEGTPLARLTAQHVKHPSGAGTDMAAITGSATPLRDARTGPFRSVRLTPRQVREELAGRPALAVATARPLLATEEAELAAAATSQDARVLLLPYLLHEEPTGMPPEVLVRAVRASAPRLAQPAGPALVVPLPLAPGTGAEPAAGVPEYAAAAEATLYGSGQLDEQRWRPVAEALDGDRELTGLVAADVAAVLREWRPLRPERGLTVFFTGLSGSGKSTVARGVADALLERGRKVTMLDGDIVRRLLSSGLTFSRADRDLNILRIGWVASEVTRHGGAAVCAPIAPYAETRAEVRRMVERHGEFVLIHVSTPLEVCEQRDQKGLYAKARAGLIENFTGVSDPYEEPRDADVTLDTSSMAVEDAVAIVVGYLDRGGWLE